jgi:succinate dehydrogenase/fumarate reductase cytochrome b subunit
VFLFGLVVLAAATAALVAGSAAGRRLSPTLVATTLAGLALTLEGMRQPRESMLFGSLLVVLAFGGLMVASLSMAVGPQQATWLPNRRGAAACTVGAVVVMALGFGLVPATSR